MKPRNAHKRQMSVTDCKNYKNCQNVGNDDSVTEATETMKPLHLTNRFQPLLQIPMDDACSSQPMLTDQAKNILVGKKTKMGFWQGFPITPATSSPHIGSSLAMVVQKILERINVPCMKLSWFTSQITNYWNKKNEPFNRDSYGTNMDSLSMHKLIVDHIQTGNLEYQYQEMTLEPSIDLESIALYDHMFDQSESRQSKDFGFIPKSSLKLYAGPQVTWDEVPDIFQAHTLVKASNLPNYMGCRIPVNSGLNIPKWRHYLAGYWDKQLCDLLEYGFPLDFDRKCPLNSVEENHTSANENASHISKFLEDELQYQAILGPFDNKPIDMHVSP